MCSSATISNAKIIGKMSLTLFLALSGNSDFLRRLVGVAKKHSVLEGLVEEVGHILERRRQICERSLNLLPSMRTSSSACWVARSAWDTIVRIASASLGISLQQHVACRSVFRDLPPFLQIRFSQPNQPSTRNAPFCLTSCILLSCTLASSWNNV